MMEAIQVGGRPGTAKSTKRLRGAQCCGSAGCKHLALAPRPNLDIVESPTERFKKEVSSIF